MTNFDDRCSLEVEQMGPGELPRLVRTLAAFPGAEQKCASTAGLAIIATQKLNETPPSSACELNSADTARPLWPTISTSSTDR